jgi:hypothetical protein
MHLQYGVDEHDPDFYVDSTNQDVDQFSECGKYNVFMLSSGHMLQPSLIYPQSIGDPKLTMVSQMAKGELHNGCSLCADKGYTIFSECAHIGVHLMLPDHLVNLTFTKEQAQHSSIKEQMQSNQADICSDVLYVASFLCTLSPALRKTELSDDEIDMTI